MLDLSPEKLLVLLAVGLVVLGPDKLPGAARGLAHGLTRARRLAASLTEPMTSTLAEPLKTSLTDPLKAGLSEPRQLIDHALADLRSTIAAYPLQSPAPLPASDPSSD